MDSLLMNWATDYSVIAAEGGIKPAGWCYFTGQPVI